ncbi:hypothetical protein OUZ56_033375 [Daphnia magna]|uniref:Glutamine amidotransferase domain-containing protein n=2 Tax=Daphnia magna TaxID=35525 RepID=A0ABQ9ZXZ3_9CRUS|nr:hypothetical protein OUZ56_033375 [Daphnia magna]
MLLKGIIPRLQFTTLCNVRQSQLLHLGSLTLDHKDSGVIDCRVRDQCVESANVLALETPAALLLQQGSQLSLRSGCPTIRPNNLYLRSSSAGNLLCMQLLNKELGGTVERKDVCEDGQFEIQVETECPLFKGLETRQTVLLTHGDSVDKVAEGLRCVAKSSRHIISTIADTERRLYGV